VDIKRNQFNKKFAMGLQCTLFFKNFFIKLTFKPRFTKEVSLIWKILQPLKKFQIRLKKKFPPKIMIISNP
jgi:hypothetical protein